MRLRRLRVCGLEIGGDGKDCNLLNIRAEGGSVTEGTSEGEPDCEGEGEEGEGEEGHVEDESSRPPKSVKPIA